MVIKTAMPEKERCEDRMRMLVDGEEPSKRQRSRRGQNGECRLGSIGDLRQEEEPIEHRRQKDRIRDKTNHKKRLGKKAKMPERRGRRRQRR